MERMKRKAPTPAAVCLLLLLPVFGKCGEVEEDRILADLAPGYGNAEVLYLQGRVYEFEEDHQKVIEKIPGSRMKKAISTLLRIFPDGEDEERVFLQSGEAWKKVRSDEEGYFEAELRAPKGKAWKGAVRVKAVPPGGEAAWGVAYVPDPGAKMGVISDIDDTIKETHVHNKSRMVKDVLLGDATTDEAVHGMASLYCEIADSGRRGERPVFYVSASPESLASRLADFLTLNRFPAGSLSLFRLESPEKLLNDYSGRIRRHKTGALMRILDTFPEMHFLLFGDSGQHDAELYTRIAATHPGRIEAIYIRNVEGGEADPRDYALCLFFTSPEEVRVDLTKRGFLKAKR